MIKDAWSSMANKRDVIYVLGDAAFNDEALLSIRDLPGRKVLISGNHDNLTSQEAQGEVFEKVYGFLRYKKMWLSHAPVHPSVIKDSRCYINIHGHTHKDEPEDERYFSVDPEVLWGKGIWPMITLDELRERTHHLWVQDQIA